MPLRELSETRRPRSVTTAWHGTVAWCRPETWQTRVPNLARASLAARHQASTPSQRLPLNLGVWVLLLLTAPVPAALPQQELTPETNLETADLTPVSRAEELLSSGRLEPALDLLVPLLERTDMRPVRAQSFRVGPRQFDLYLPLGDLLQRKFAVQALTHPERLAAYRRRADARATQALREARALDDSDLEARVIECFLLASPAPAAAESLADRLAEQARWTEACRWYNRLLANTPASLLDPPAISLPLPGDPPRTAEQQVQLLAKSAYAHLQQGHFKQARQRLEQARSITDNPTRLAPHLQSLLQQGIKLPPATSTQSDLVPRSPSDVPATINLELEWSIALDPLPSPWIDRRLAVSPLSAEQLWPVVEPLLTEGRMAIWNGRRLRWLDALMGTPIFPVDSSDDSDPIRRGTIWVAPAWSAPLDSRLAEGTPRYTVERQGMLLGIRAGDPRAVIAESTSRDQATWMAFDLTREGALIPGVPAVGPDQSTWTGCPVPGNSMWYAIARHGPGQAERVASELIALEPVVAPSSTSLPIVWRQSLGEAPSATAGRYSEFSHVRAHVDADEVFVAGSSGVIAAFHSSTGTPRWWLTYPRIMATSSDPLADPSPRFRDGGDLRCVDSHLFALPEDSDLIIRIDRDQGLPQWALPLGAARRVLGVVNTRLIVAGDRLHWLDSQTGKLLHDWPETYPVSLPGSMRFGASLSGLPALNPSESRIGVTFDGQWWELDAETGRPLFQATLPPECGLGGHVIWLDSGLWVTSASTTSRLQRPSAPSLD